MGRIGTIKGGLDISNRSPIAKAVREFRLEHSWSQAEFADAAGISRPVIGILENESAEFNENRIPIMTYTKLRDAGLDLKTKFPDLTISDGKGRRARHPDPDMTIKAKGDKFNQSMQKALNLVTEAKKDLEARVSGIDQAISKIEKHIEGMLAEVDALKIKKDNLIQRAHKADLGIDNINKCIIGPTGEACPCGSGLPRIDQH